MSEPIDVFLYFAGRLDVGLDEVEDDLDEALRGIGEVTGVGTGMTGSNVDLVIEQGNKSNGEIVALVRRALSRFSIPRMSKVVIAEEEFPL